MKKFKLCFKTEDYETQSTVNTIFIILDKSRGYYGVKFSIDDSKIKYGSVICTNSGNEYDSHYFNRVFYRWCFYHRHPNWDKKHKSTILKFYNFTVKVPVPGNV